MFVLSALRFVVVSGLSGLGNLLLGPAARAAELVADADARLVWSSRLARQSAVASQRSMAMPRA